MDIEKIRLVASCLEDINELSENLVFKASEPNGDGSKCLNIQGYITMTPFMADKLAQFLNLKKQQFIDETLQECKDILSREVSSDGL